MEHEVRELRDSFRATALVIFLIFLMQVSSCVILVGLGRGLLP